MSAFLADLLMVGAVFAVYVVGAIGVAVASVALLFKIQEWRS